MTTRMHGIDVDCRKRPLPSSSDLSVPPNKKIPRPTAKEQREKNKRERELLHQRSILESRTPFYLQPRIPLPFPIIQPASVDSTKSQYGANSIGSVGSYSFLPTPSTPSNTLSSSYSISSLVGETTSASKPPQSPYSSYTNCTKRQPQTPHSNLGVFSPWSSLQNGMITGLPTPPSNNSLTNGEFVTDSSNTHSVKNNDCNSTTCGDNNQNKDNQIGNEEHGQRTNSSKAPTISSRAFSPYPARMPGIASPFFYMYNNTPLSPVVLLGSPCGPSSVKSIPSVGSSSGCSSMSEGSVLSMDRMNSDFLPRIAPTEYHVGIKPPHASVLEDSNASDGTPTPDSDDDEIVDIDVERVESCSNIRSSLGGSLSTQFDNNSTCVPIDERCPLSVQRLIGKKRSSPQNTALYHSNISSPITSRESSPEPDCEEELNHASDMCQGSLKMAGNGEDVFCLVPGRLSLLSATKKYKITVDEVKRRLSNPECLNASVLGGILRRAKSKNGGHHLRQRLEENGLSLPPGRRKATEVTLFTSLVEGEALHLANDHKRICQNFFPHQELAQVVGRQHASTPQVKERMRMVEGASVLLSEFQAMVDTSSQPSNLRPEDPSNPYPGLTNFNLISHGFGNPAISTAVSVLQNYLQELRRIYDGGNPHPHVCPSREMGVVNGEMGGVSDSHGQQRMFMQPLNLLKQEPNEI